MTEQQIQKLVDRSPVLQRLTRRLSVELERADPTFTFDPFLILMLLGIVINVLIHCRSERNVEDIEFDVRRFKALPPRALMRLKRRLNRLWLEQNPTAPLNAPNPLVQAVYGVAANLRDDEVAAVMHAVKK